MDSLAGEGAEMADQTDNVYIKGLALLDNNKKERKGRKEKRNKEKQHKQKEEEKGKNIKKEIKQEKDTNKTNTHAKIKEIIYLYMQQVGSIKSKGNRCIKEMLLRAT